METACAAATDLRAAGSLYTSKVDPNDQAAAMRPASLELNIKSGAVVRHTLEVEIAPPFRTARLAAPTVTRLPVPSAP